MIISNNELLNIRGGGSFISGTVLNGIVKGVQFLYSIGQAFGTAINRMKNKNYC